MPRDRTQRHSRRRSSGTNGNGNGNGHASSSKLLGHSEPHIAVETAEEFWRELEAIVTLTEVQRLVVLDNSIRMFVTFCGAYHGELLWLNELAGRVIGVSRKGRGNVLCLSFLLKVARAQLSSDKLGNMERRSRRTMLWTSLIVHTC